MPFSGLAFHCGRGLDDVFVRDQVAVLTTDNGVVFGPLSVEVTLEILVSKTPRPPSVTNQVFSVVENSLPDTFVGIMAIPQSGVPLLYTITGGNVNSVFRMQNCSGIIFVNTLGVDFETRSVYNLTVTVLGDLSVNATALIYVSGKCYLCPALLRRQGVLFPLRLPTPSSPECAFLRVQTLTSRRL